MKYSSHSSGHLASFKSQETGNEDVLGGEVMSVVRPRLLGNGVQSVGGLREVDMIRTFTCALYSGTFIEYLHLTLSIL